jgi:hypothetical protein
LKKERLKKEKSVSTLQTIPKLSAEQLREEVKTLSEWARILKPGGRLHIGDILVARSVPQEALGDISLWTG